eukprot:scaffold54060_cov32-Cyclotella_meneghiniana.AAC.6
MPSEVKGPGHEKWEISGSLLEELSPPRLPCAPARRTVSFITLHLKLPALRASGDESDFWPIALSTLFFDN